MIGAGVAGLTCAELVAKAGLRVLVLEARERIGGRILTHFDKYGYPIELGAEFVHGEDPGLLKRIEEAGLRLRRVNEEPWCREGDKLEKCPEFWQQTEKVLEQMRKTAGDQSFLQFLRRPKMKKFSAEAKDSAIRYVEGFNAARKEDISLNSLVTGMREEENIGEKQFRIAGGYAALVHSIYEEALAAGAWIETGAEVKSVRWKRGQVRLTVASGPRRVQMTAEKLVVTLPLGVLQAGSVKFFPALAAKQKAIRKLRMGEVVRVALEFRERFWQDLRPEKGGATLRRMGFLFSHDPHFPTWWTQMPSNVPVMVGWSPSRHTKKLSGLSHAAIQRKALASLAKILGVSTAQLRRSLVEGHIHDWQADRFSAGAYSYAKVGGEPAQKTLARPVAATLFFAGEATCFDGTNGTVHGAMRSGTRVAGELLRMRKRARSR